MTRRKKMRKAKNRKIKDHLQKLKANQNFQEEFF